jgi:hypothetical protein
MLTLKASVATAILIGSIAATAGATYVATKTAFAVNCPAPTVPPHATDNRGIPLGEPLPLNQGRKW